MQDNETLSFEDGETWTIKTVVTRRMRKAFRKAGMAIAMAAQGKDVDFTNPGAVIDFFRENPEAFDMDAVEDAYLIQGTIKTSLFKGEPTVEKIDALADRYVERVLVRMRELYQDMTEETYTNLDGTVSPSALEQLTPAE